MSAKSSSDVAIYQLFGNTKFFTLRPRIPTSMHFMYHNEAILALGLEGSCFARAHVQMAIVHHITTKIDNHMEEIKGPLLNIYRN